MVKKTTFWTAFAVATLLATALPAVEAQGRSNPGTIKIHDDLETEPEQRNEPHVSCDFYVEGFNMEGETGVLRFFAWPPTGDMSEVTPTGDSTVWVGTPEGDESGGFHFLEGPFFLDPGHYRVEAYSDTRTDTARLDDHFEKAKMFWVDPCVVNGDGQPPECPPTTLTAIPQQDGSIDVTVTSEDEDAVFNLYRAVSGGEFEYVATLDENETYTDTDTEVGVTYEYAVTVFDEESGLESEEFCARAQATAIPFFPGVVVGSLALLGGVGAFVMLRRRKA